MSLFSNRAWSGAPTPWPLSTPAWSYFFSFSGPGPKVWRPPGHIKRFSDSAQHWSWLSRDPLWFQRMRLLRRRHMPLRLAIVGSAFVLFLFILQRDVNSREQATEKPWLKSLVSQKDHVLDLMVGAMNNLKDSMPKLQIRAPEPQETLVSTNKVCPPGFYTPAELKPFWERPPQDPNGPGADGKAFQKDKWTPLETQEKEEGYKKHCFNAFASDRISLQRALGPDTRPPE